MAFGGVFPAFSACRLAASPIGQAMEYLLGGLREDLKGFSVHTCFGFFLLLVSRFWEQRVVTVVSQTG